MDEAFRSSSRDWLTLCGALALLALVLAAVSCGGEDLTFPGNVPATGTSAPTSTATP